jgi:AcrR family transcriptional regulator
MARPKAATFDLQRAAILHSAAQLFASHGYHHASMSQLAQACGVSKALLYHYYRDKQHILFDIADHYMDALLTIVAQVRAEKLPVEAHLKTLISRFMQTYRHAQAQHMVLVQDVKFLEAQQRLQVQEKERQVVQAFARAIAALEPRLKGKALEVPLAMILFGMINWTFTWLRPDGPMTYEDMAQVVNEVFLHGVSGEHR